MRVVIRYRQRELNLVQSGRFGDRSAARVSRRSAISSRTSPTRDAAVERQAPQDVSRISPFHSICHLVRSGEFAPRAPRDGCLTVSLGSCGVRRRSLRSRRRCRRVRMPFLRRSGAGVEERFIAPRFRSDSTARGIDEISDEALS
jgi:hypothetical protein